MSKHAEQSSDAFDTVVAHWLNRKRSGEMSVEEVRAFQVWLDEPENREAYGELEQLWDELGDLAEDPAIIKSRERDTRRFDRRAQMRSAGVIAAGVALVSVCSWAIATSGILADLGLQESPLGQELRTSVGQRTTVTLKDKSVVTLDTDTILRLRDSGRERRIELVRGRAFFQVAKDKSRPFIVVAEGRAVQATGTAFDVRAEQGRLQVTLVEGRVRVRDIDGDKSLRQSAEMRAGWRLDAIGQEPWRVAAIDLRKETSWHEGKLSFLNDPVAEAVAEVNRYSERKIVFRGPPPDVPMIGVFRAGDVDGFVKGLELNKLARVVRSDESVVELARR